MQLCGNIKRYALFVTVVVSASLCVYLCMRVLCVCASAQTKNEKLANVCAGVCVSA